MPVRSLPHIRTYAQRKQSYLLALLCVVTISSLANASPSVANTSPVRDEQGLLSYAYATPGSATTYDIMLAGGGDKDRRIASVKVDGVAFGDASARLSHDGSHVAVRVTGDRYGGSSLHIVDVKTGKTTQIASSKNSAEGFGTYKWSPAGNTLAFVRASPALDPAGMEDAYGYIYIFSVGFQATRLQGSQTNDLLLGFAGDGLGVYVSRREVIGGQWAQHLIYLPTGGGEPVMMMRSVPDLRYTQFVVYAPPGEPARIAGIAEGSFVVAPTASVRITQGAVASPGRAIDSPTSTIKLVKPRSLGLVISDPAGTWPRLVRQDAEAYPYMAWAADGHGLLMGGSRTGSSLAIDMAGNKRLIEMSLFGMEAMAWSSNGPAAILSDNPVTRLVTLNYATGAAVATRYVGVAPKPGAAAVKLEVPYVHQVNDTAASGDGNWACGPTSVVMSLAYYGKLDPWPVYVAQQAISPTTRIDISDSAYKLNSGAAYAPYITNYFALNGRTYNAVARDPRGNMLAGLYGTICPTGLADWQTITSVFNSNGLGSQYVEATWDGITGALKRGHPVLLGNELTPAGHILVVRGYTADGNLIVNDPYGNRFAPGYGATDGQGLYYQWKRATARRALEVIGVYPPPTRTPVPTATPVPTSTPWNSPTPLPGISTPALETSEPTVEYIPPVVEPPTPEQATHTATPGPPIPAPTLVPEPTPSPTLDGSMIVP